MSQDPILSVGEKNHHLLPYLCLATVFLTLALGSLFFVSLYVKAPNKEEITLVIPLGSSVQEIAKRLDEKNLLLHPVLFRISSKLMANDQLKAGEYTFPAGLDVLKITKILKEGKTVLRQITVPEGLTSFEIMQLLDNDKTLTGTIEQRPIEGSLLPETYHYSYSDSRSNFINRMQQSQKELLEKLWAKRDQSLPFKSPEEAVIMASIIEKETGPKAEERPMVASVFINRLRKGMPLQSDPTVIYALTHGIGKLGRPLLRKDWGLESPMNTYQNTGLPPKPICNPGQKALEATLRPAQTDYLYFVADGSGGHAFARSLKEHNKNVAQWIKIRKQQN